MWVATFVLTIAIKQLVDVNAGEIRQCYISNPCSIKLHITIIGLCEGVIQAGHFEFGSHFEKCPSHSYVRLLKILPNGMLKLHEYTVA